MVEECSESFYAKYLRISLPFLLLVFLSISVFALTTSDNNYSGGVYNGGFEYGTGIKNSGGFIGDKNYGWFANENVTSAIFEYDTSQKHSGNQSMRLQTDTTGRAILYQGSFTFNLSGNAIYFNKVKPNTTYIFSAWVKTQDVNNNAVKIRAGTYTSSYSPITSYDSSTLSGTNDWTLLTRRFTTGATAGLIRLELWNNVAGKDSNAWFDDVRLEEVGTTNLSGQVSGRPSILVTGVSDFNAIDQADTNNDATSAFSNGTTTYNIGQCFTPTQNKFSGIIIQKGESTGTFTGDIIVSLRDSDATNTVPSRETAPLAQVIIPNATWEAITNKTDYRISLPFTLDANGTKKYCVDFNATTFDASNYPRMYADSNASYSGGTRVSFNGSVWTATAGTSIADLYFKTLFEKQSSAFDLNVCSQGDSVCESKTYNIDFLGNDENYIIDPSDAPLFYGGDNNVYFMMHSDSDFNNKTPSMTAKLTYTFDHPTTSLTRTKGTIDNTEIITLTCTNGTTGNCDQTYYSFNGSTYYTYSTPFTLNNGTYNIKYYSTADNNNTETINTSSFTVPIQGSTATCSVTGLFPLLLIAFGITSLGGLFFTKQFLDTGDMNYMINFILMLIIGVLILITIAPILC